MWTEITRPKYERGGLRYASDLTDGEWGVIAPFLPARKPTGRPRTTELREVVNAILYMLRAGCPWRMLPKDFPPRSTVQRYFYAWRDDGTWARINHHLVMALREAEGREASPSAGVIDSQPAFAEAKLRLRAGRSAKTTESGGIRGFDAGKKVKGRKRHILTDTGGLLIGAVVHGADIQDRDGAPLLLDLIRHAFPWLRHLFADGAYAGDKLGQALANLGRWTLEIVKRSDSARGFEVLPRRWVVERTFAWMGRNRRLAKDFETALATAEAWLYLASVQLITRRLATH
ncbi:MAG: IS5 family transposase [Acidiferrobacterales bacterium]